MGVGVGVRIRLVERDRPVHGDELQRRTAGPDRPAQVARADLAGDLDREVGLDAAVHRFGIDVRVDLLRQPRAHRTVHGGEPDIAARKRLHVRFDAAVDCRRLDRTGRRIHRDAAVDRRGFDRRAHAVDFQPAVHGRRIDGNVPRQLHGEAHRDVVLLYAVHAIVAALVAALVARFPQGADGEAALGEHGNQLHALWVGVAPALLDIDHEAVARSRDDFDRPVRVADPDVLRRLDEGPVFPRIANLAAAPEEIAAFPVAPVEIAERPEGAQRGRDANADAADEEAGPDDETEEHAAADDLATPRAPETPSRCSRLIE